MGLPLTSGRSGSKAVLLVALCAVLGGLVVLLFGSRLFVFQLPMVRLPRPKLSMVQSGIRDTAPYVVFAIHKHTHDAREIVREERQRTQAERDAFEAFILQIQRVHPIQPTIATEAPTMAANVSTTQTNQHQRIERAYRETVMGVEHYEEEYGDTLTESMAAELGPELATQLRSNGQFTPLVKQQLLKTAGDCRKERDRFLPILAREASALETALATADAIEARLDRVSVRLPSESSLSDLIATDTRLGEDEKLCEELLLERQAQRVSGHTALEIRSSTLSDLQSYLYQPLSVTYPVLVDTTELLERVHKVRRHISREIAWRS